jgi:peptide/nickel transport system permease protein
VTASVERTLAGRAPRTLAAGPSAARRLARDPAAAVGLIVLLAFAAAAIAAPWVAPADPNRVDLLHRFEPLSRAHWLGTDNLGRDVFSRILHGGRLSIGIAIAATAGSTALGTTLGMLAGMHGGSVDALIMRTVDVLQALPGLLLALAVVGVLGQGLNNLLIAMVLVWWAGYARVVRAMTLSIGARQFVEAARAAGATERRVLIRHVLPNLVGPTVVLSTLDMGRTLLAVSGFSFLGLGARPPIAEWGAMLAEAKNYLDRAPFLLIAPGFAITVMVLASNLIGDGLRDALDPRLARQTMNRV